MTFEEPVAIEEPVAVSPEPRPEPPRKPLWTPLLLVMAGMAVIYAGSLYEERLLEGVRFSKSLIVMGEKPKVDGAVPVLMRRIPEENLPPNSVMAQVRHYPGMAETLKPYGLDKPKLEPVVRMELPEDALKGLLASGRLPKPDRPEVLSGPLTRFDRFTMDGTTFEVVGRIREDIPAFTFCYLWPGPAKGPDFLKGFGERGWFLEKGLPERLGRMVKAPDEPAPLKVLGGFARTPAAVTFTTIFGLFLVCAGSMIFIPRLVQRPWVRRLRFVRPLADELALRPGLLLALHAANYGAWFLGMTAALAFPRGNLFLVQMLQTVFTSGSLEHVGEAYASGNIFQAAMVTFVQNYFVATLFGTVFWSLFIFGIGVLKNLLSFSVLGFGMAPIWAGRSGGYVYHSITIGLELEAYILASFIVLVWPIRLVLGVVRGKLFANFLQGLKVLLAGIAFIAVVLLVAAFYEATTLILLQP